MALPDELKFLEAPLKHFNYTPTWPSLLRIAAWMVLFITLYSIIVPRPPSELASIEPLHGTRVAQMNTSPDDPRWVRGDIETFPEDGLPNIAWLAESSILLLESFTETGGDLWSSAGYLPERVTGLMEKQYNIKANMFLYLITARRIVDAYTMTRDALLRRPDALVITLDPFWDYNNKAMFFRKSVFNRGAELWWNKDDWPWQFLLASPSNHLWNLVGRNIPFINLRHDFQEWIIQTSKKLIKTDPKNLKTSKSSKSSGAQIKLLQSLRFWALFRMFGGDINKLYPDGEMDVAAMYNAAIMVADTQPNALPNRTLHNMLTLIQDSGVSALIYLTPVSPDMNDPQALASYHEVIVAMRNLQQQYQTPRVKFVLEFPETVIKSMQFMDYVHVYDGGILPQYLAEQIAEIVKLR